MAVTIVQLKRDVFLHALVVVLVRETIGFNDCHRLQRQRDIVAFNSNGGRVSICSTCTVSRYSFSILETPPHARAAGSIAYLLTHAL